MRLSKAINQRAFILGKLTKLTLCQIGLDNACLEEIAEAIRYIKHLNYLDISANLFDAFGLKNFFDTVEFENKIRTLNISYNQAKYKAQHKFLELSTASFEASLSNYLETS